MKVLGKVTRFEVITSSGRELVKYFAPGTVRYEFQDDEQTFKVFLMEPDVPNWKYKGKGFNMSDLRHISKFCDGSHFQYFSNPTLPETYREIEYLKSKGLEFTEDEE